MSVTSVWCGGTTPTSVRVVGRVVGSSVRLAVATNAQLSNPTFYGPVIPTSDNVAAFQPTDLTASTQYWYALEVDSVLDTDFQGTFRTHPPLGEPATYTFWTAGDAGLTPDFPGEGTVFRSDRISNHPVFSTIANHELNPLFGIHLGDLHYYNPTQIIGGEVADYRRCLDDVLLQSHQHNLYRHVPLVWTYDDHDYGDNDSDGSLPTKANGAQVYRERVPHYPLPDPGAIYHAFTVARTLFVILDTRFYRSNNLDPDGPGKTMLGTAQKEWLANLLSTSTAQALVLVSSSQWLAPAGTDQWVSFATERQEIADLLVSTGWAPDRMIMISADAHTLAMDSGASNLWGGFPAYLFASLDASPSSVTEPYDIGISNDRAQYGMITVADSGEQITITARGYRSNTLLMTHTVTIAAEAPGDGGPVVPPVSAAVPRTRVTWFGCDLVSGGIVAELPEIRGQISRVIGSYTSASLEMPIPLGGEGSVPRTVWEPATEPGRTMIVPVVNDVPAAGLIVLAREGGTDAMLRLGCVSIEGYLERRYVGDHTWTQQDEASVIAAGLVADARPEGINLVVDAPATGTLRDRTYVATDDATVYSRLRELAGVEDGPEWTIDVDWADATRQSIAKIVRIRKRIGTPASPPNAILSAVGTSEATYAYAEDYSTDRGANFVIATGTGEGEDRPQSSPATDIPQGWPRYERRFNPSISDVATLNGHATRELELRKLGSRTIKISARWDVEPALNLHARLGDDIGWELKGHRHPQVFTGVGRMIGWELDLQAGLWSPILLQPDGEV